MRLLNWRWSNGLNGGYDIIRRIGWIGWVVRILSGEIIRSFEIDFFSSSFWFTPSQRFRTFFLSFLSVLLDFSFSLSFDDLCYVVS